MSQFKKIAAIITPLLICAGFAAGCGNTKNLPENDEVQKAVYRKINAEQAKKIMDQDNPYTLLDVRNEEEFNEERISGAILIPVTEIDNRAENELPNKNALILVYCRSGRRSASAANTLVSMGYTNVYDIGGIINWPYGTIKE